MHDVVCEFACAVRMRRNRSVHFSHFITKLKIHHLYSLIKIFPLHSILNFGKREVGNVSLSVKESGHILKEAGPGYGG